jgi:hypothetical protein
MSEHKLLFFVEKDEISHHPLEIAKKMTNFFFREWLVDQSL